MTLEMNQLTRKLRPEERSEGELDVNKEGHCDEKDDDVPEEVVPPKRMKCRHSRRYYATLKERRIKCWKLICM